MNFRRLIYMIMTSAVAILSDSCVKDQIDDYGMMYVAGKDTRISLRVSVPEMSVATRGDMSNGADFAVNSLWVGIFSASDGECTYAAFRSERPGEHKPFVTLDKISTKSGPSYIVAVANPENNYGYVYNPDSPTVSRTPLDEILPESMEKAIETGFTWTSYKNIAIRQLDLNDVNTPVGNLVMSGIFVDNNDAEFWDSDDPRMPSAWEDLNAKPFNIPVSTNNQPLAGAVHLRRLLSQVRFRISTEPYTPENPTKTGRTLVEIIPQSFQVRNVPYTSWLHERKAALSVDALNNGANAVTNSGDVIRLNSASLGYDETKGEILLHKANYRVSSWFNGSQYLQPHYETRADGTQEEKPSYYDFDFWMLENKRWASNDVYEGLDPVKENDKAYDRREDEFKKAENDYGITENTGLYTALCDNGAETLNNCASFVELRCRIIYTDDGLDAIRDERDKNYPDYSEVQYRSADAVYTIHLGGIGSNWNDYTHRRNHKYTYTVKIMDVDRIIVEGRTDEESRPGIEGIVTDVVNPPFDVDCHYAVFNIQLSNYERTGGGIDEGDGNMNTGGDDKDVNGSGSSKYEKGRFPFRIKYYDETDFAHYIDQMTVDEYKDPDKEWYWNWVEFRPTTGPDEIARYRPYWDGTGVKPQYADGKTFRLTDVHNIEKYPHDSDKDHNEKDITQRWYTVFVNEYIYEQSTNEEANNWRNYVNLSPRMCWINTLFRSSIDDESTYIRSKYVVRQASIQSFYAIPEGHSGDDINAIGMEHTNETFGFNLRWDNVTTHYEMYDHDGDSSNPSHDIKNNNGRHNTLLYLLAVPGKDGLGYITGSRGNSWDDYVHQTALQYITDLNPAYNQYDTSYQLRETPYLSTSDDDRHPYYLIAAKTYTGGRKLPGGYSDINQTYFLRILDACMNRNRDNNGNGVIDLDEIRWYVPASSEIVDLVLGRNSLGTPLIDYEINGAINSPPRHLTKQIHQGNTRFHYATSNQRVLWADEGATLNPESDVLGGDWNLPPLNVRCVRALGTDLTTDLNTDLTPAFTTNAAIKGGYPTEIYPTYYESKNLRSYSETLPEHQEKTGDLNRVCVSGFQFQKELIDFYEDVTVTVTVDDDTTLPGGWYKDGIQDLDHLYKDGNNNPLDPPLDPAWSEKYPNARWLDGKLFKTKSSGGYYFKAIPGTRSDGWFNGCIKVDGWEEPVAWYVLDKNKYSKTQVSGYMHFDGFWYGGTTHEAGWFKPDVKTRIPGDKNTSPGDGYVWWDEMRILTVYDAGFYWPDPKTGPLTNNPGGYAYFDEDFGDEWHPMNTYQNLDLSSESDTFKWGYAQAYEVWNGFVAGKWYRYGGNDNGANCYGFWTGEQHKPGWYARDYERGRITDYNQWGAGPKNWNQPPVLPAYDAITLDEGLLEAGWYKADESKKGNGNQSGYKYYPEWNVGGEYCPEGWYDVEYSEKEVPGLINVVAKTENCPGGWYEADFSDYSETKKNGQYGQIDDDQKEVEIYFEGFVPGYYDDDGWGEFITDEIQTDPAWLDEGYVYMRPKVVKSGQKHQEDITIGKWQNGERLFMFPQNENIDEFVRKHGATLQAANTLCVRKYGRGWRLPNLKEAALIKVAMDNAGVYKTNAVNDGNLTYRKDHDDASGYDIGNFLSSTYREYGVRDGSRKDQTGYYTGVYFAEANSEVQEGDWQNERNGPVLGRICCITTDQNRHYYIRCVRDLQSSGD